MAERDPRAPRIRPVRTVNHVRPDYSGNVDVEGFDGTGILEDIEELQGRTPGHVIRDEGDDLPQQPWLDFVGAGVTVTDFGGVTRVSIPGSGDGGGFGNWIDVFEGIADDTVTEFLLSYPPLDWSWNVTLNGITMLDDAVATTGDFTLDDTGVLTVTDATDLFAGASDTDPWTVQVQYERLSGIPAGTPEPVPPGEAVDILVLYRTIAEGDTTEFWDPDYDPSGWLASTDGTIAFSGGAFPPQTGGGWDDHLDDLQVRALVPGTPGVGLTISYGNDDAATYWWNGTQIINVGFTGSATYDVAGADVLASNLLAVLVTDTNPVGRGLIVTVDPT